MSKAKGSTTWSDKKRIEACTAYLALGNASFVEIATGVPAGTVRQWKTQPWWKELVDQIQTESDQELDTKLAKLIDKSLSLVNDRLDNGDFMWDSKNSEFVRKPVGLKDTWKVSTEMLDKRWLIRDRPDTKVDTEAVSDILLKLAKDFAGMAKTKVKEKLDESGLEESNDGGESSTQGPDTELQEGVRQLSGEARTDQEPSGEESREGGVVEGGVGS